MLAEANNKLSIQSNRALSLSGRALGGVYSALGGPVGVLTLAGSGRLLFHNKSVEARESAINLKYSS